MLVCQQIKVRSENSYIMCVNGDYRVNTDNFPKYKFENVNNESFASVVEGIMPGD